LKDFAASVIFLFLSVFVFFSSQSFSSKGRRYFSLAYNPAMYPRIIALILFILSVILIVQAIRKGAFKNIKIHIDRQKAVKVIKLLLGVLLYIVGINYIGYITATLLCVILFVYLFDGTIKQAILYSIGLTAVLYVIFRMGFKILLPVGKIFETWG